MSDLDINNNIINVNGLDLVFKYDVAEVIKIKDLAIVRLSIPLSSSIDIKDFDNVYCIDNYAQIKWQVKKLSSQTNSAFKIAPIILLNYINGSLQATDFMGRKYEIHVETGEMNLIGVSK